MSCYRLVPLVWEQDPASADVWVATIPDGPLLRIGGIGACILNVLQCRDMSSTEEESGPDSAGVGGSAKAGPELSAEVITETVLCLAPRAPADASVHIRRFLHDLEVHGIVERVDQ